MNQSKLLIYSGALLLALAFGFAACGPQAPVTPADVKAPTDSPAEIMTEAPVEEPVASAETVLEVVGPAANLSFTMADLTPISSTMSTSAITRRPCSLWKIISS